MLGLGLLRLAGGFLVAVAVGALIAPVPPLFGATHRQVLAAAAVTAALFAAGSVLWSLIRRTSVVRGWLRSRFARPACSVSAVVLSIGGAAACTWLALQLRYEVGWDVGVVDDISRTVTSDAPLTQAQAGYLSRYPNTLALLALHNAGRAIAEAFGGDPGVVLVLLNGLCLAVTLQATHALGSLLGRPAAGLAAQVLVLLLVGLSPWMAVAYTDILALPFTILGPLMLMRSRRASSRTRAGLLLVGSAACTAIAVHVKTTPAVLVVAGVLYALLLILRRPERWLRGVGTLVAGLILVGAALFGLRATAPALAGVPAAAVDRSRTPPPIWWFAMGTNERVVNDTVRYGGYDPLLVGLTRELDSDMAGVIARAYLDHRMEQLGPTGYVVFLVRKAVFTWGDGTFWAWNEGADARSESFTHTGTADWVRSWNRAEYPYWQVRGAIATGLWCVLLVVLGVRLLRSPLRHDAVLVALTLLGFAAFTLLSQGRSRYLLVAVPLVAALVTSLPPAIRRSTRRPAGSAAPGQSASVTGTPCADDSPTTAPSTLSSGAPR